MKTFTVVSVYGVDYSKVERGEQSDTLCALFGMLLGDIRYRESALLARRRAQMTRQMIAAFGKRHAKRHETVIPLEGGE